MKKTTFVLMPPAPSSGSPVLAAVEYKAVADWLKLPDGRPQIGNMHGDIAVSSKGEVYVSVEDPQAGLQVYGQDGRFLRNVPNAPPDLPRLRHPPAGGRASSSTAPACAARRS